MKEIFNIYTVIAFLCGFGACGCYRTIGTSNPDFWAIECCFVGIFVCDIIAMAKARR